MSGGDGVEGFPGRVPPKERSLNSVQIEDFLERGRGREYSLLVCVVVFWGVFFYEDRFTTYEAEPEFRKSQSCISTGIGLSRERIVYANTVTFVFG